jgi:hypothetical protein
MRMSSLELLAAVSFLATLIAGFVVGGRLLLLARDTQRAAESFVGISVATLALAGALEVLGLELARAGNSRAAYPMEVVAIFLHSASASSLCFGIWRIFHPDRRWAFYVCVAISALLFDSWMAVSLPGRHTSETDFTDWFHLNVAMRALAAAWGAYEAFAHHRRLRRRLALGLADRLTCHRFLLWGFALACTVGIFAAALVTNVVIGVLVFAWSPALLGVGGLGLCGAWALWVAVLPPRFYRRIIEGAEPVAATDPLA